MSVINQMLQGLDKKQQLPPVNTRNHAVIVASSERGNSVLILLLVAIILMAVLVGYLLLQKKTALVTTNEVTQLVGILANPELLTSPTPTSASVTPNVLLVEDVDDNAINTHAEDRQHIAPLKIVKSEIASPTIIESEIAQPKIPETSVIAQIATIKTLPSNPAEDITKSIIPAKPTVAAVDNDQPEIENKLSIKAVTRTPQQQVQFYFKQAKSALLSGDQERAKQLFYQILALDPQHDLSREQLAALLYGEQRTKLAVALLREGLTISPEYATFRLILARIYLQNKNKQQAYYYLKPYQPEITDNLDYYAMLAGLAQNLGDLDIALSTYQKLTEYDPNRARWWLGLGITADKLHQVTLALKAYQKAQNMGQLSASSRNYIDTRIAQLEK